MKKLFKAFTLARVAGFSFAQADAVSSQSNETKPAFTLRNIYIEKAMNYVLRLGPIQFGEDGPGHNQIQAMAI